MFKRLGMALLATALTIPVSFAQEPEQQVTPTDPSPDYAGCVIPGNASACYFYWTFYRYCIPMYGCTNSTGGPNVSSTNGWFTNAEAEAQATTDRNNSTAKYKANRCTPETGGQGTFNTYFYTCVIYSTNGGPNPYN